MTLERWEFLTRCKKLLCSGLPCSTCLLEDFCMYDEDVSLEVYMPDIEGRVSLSSSQSL